MSEQSGEEVFYRYMSESEARAIGGPGEVGFLRGGRAGDTYWTDTFYATAAQAKAELALADPPEIRMRFTIRTWPERLVKGGSAAEAKYGEPGGGLEWMSDERVEVLVRDVHPIS